MITTLHIKTDKKVKERAEKLAKDNGITLTALINLSLRQTINFGKIALYAETENLEPNEGTKKILREALKDVRAGKNLSPRFASAEQAFDWLRRKSKNKWK